MYPLDTHGWRVYLSAKEHFGLEGLFAAFVVLAIAAIVIDRVKKPFASKYD